MAEHGQDDVGNDQEQKCQAEIAQNLPGASPILAQQNAEALIPKAQAEPDKSKHQPFHNDCADIARDAVTRVPDRRESARIRAPPRDRRHDEYDHNGVPRGRDGIG